jgi:hypothetical protein
MWKSFYAAIVLFLYPCITAVVKVLIDRKVLSLSLDVESGRPAQTTFIYLLSN